jgi:flavin reductase (DIM6/NTAB) family NADH-FMN oxidoreductase RutF
MSKKKLGPMALLFPTPVVLVTTVGAQGRPNILTVTCIGIACAKPPMIAMAIHPWTHSHSLLKEVGEFVVNIPPEGILEAVKYCGRASGKNEDKFAGARLTPVSATAVKPPLIAECPVNLECKVRHFLELGIHNLFIGEVVATHVAEDALLDADKGSLNVAKCAPISCVKGVGGYRSLGRTIAGLTSPPHP